MKKKTKRILIGSGVAVMGVAAAGAVSHSVTVNLVKMALDRDKPKSLKTMSKLKGRQNDSKIASSFTQTISDAAEKLRAENLETVQIRSHDGELLIGHWYACANPQRTVIAMHGWRSSWANDFGIIADFWHEHDCNVLYAEQRGQGESGGAYMGFGLLERYDCLEWISYVNERCGTELPIYLGGVSMGATTVLMAAGLSLPANVKGIVADCGFTSPHEIWKHVAEKNLHLRYGMRASAASNLCKKKIMVGTQSYSTVDAMKESTVPVLLIHGTDDRFVPIEMTYENYRSCNSPKYLLIVPGAGHGMSYYVDKDGYESAVMRFWKKYDQSPDCKG